MKLADRLRRWPIAPAQLGATGFAIADFMWVARPAAIGWLGFARGLLLAVGAGAAIGFVAGIIAGLIGGSIGRLRLGAVIAAPLCAMMWMACFGGVLVFTAHRFHDPALAAWAVALSGLAAIPIALVPAAAIARGLAPLSRRFDVGVWAAAAVAAIGSIAVLWVRPIGLGMFALAIGLVASRARPVKLRITAIAALVGAALAVSPLANDRAAWEARRDSTLIPALEAVLAPIADRDGDGRLAIFGSGDCDDGDPSIGPLAIEIAGNGIDEDCRFGDLAVRAAPPAGEALAGAVLLLTVDELDLDADGALRPPMPGIQAAIETGVRFTGGRGVVGRFVDAAPVLIDGELPLEIIGVHGGFALRGRSIPEAVERAGGRAALARPKALGDELNTAFHLSRDFHKSNQPAAIARAHAATLDASPGFVWVHLDGRRQRAAVDAAAKTLIARAVNAGAAVVVVGLPARSTGADVGGGPIAVIGPRLARAIEPRVEAAPVGLYDVYPTITRLLGLTPAPSAGRDLLGELGGPAFFGRANGAVLELGAFDDAAWVMHRPTALRIDSSVGAFAEGADGPAPVAALARALRTEILAPRLAALNRRRAARVDALPDSLSGSPSRIAGALTVYGCTVEHRPNGARFDVYFAGGGLRRADLLAFKLYAPGATSIRGVVHPAVPLSDLDRDALYRHRLDLDTGRLGNGSSFLWVGVSRDGKLLPVTGGSGSTPRWALVCRYDPPEGERQ